MSREHASVGNNCGHKGPFRKDWLQRAVAAMRPWFAECGDCGYLFRTTAKWIETGLPTCHCGGEFEVRT